MSGKRSRRLLALLLAGASVSLPMTTLCAAESSLTNLEAMQADDLERVPIHSILITSAIPDPDHVIDPRILKAKLRTREGDLFSQSAFDSDLKMLADSYDRIDPQLRQTSEGLEITLRITPRPLIQEILFVGNQGLGRRRLENKLGLTLQSPLNRKELMQGLQKVRQEYIRKGFFEARIEPEIERIPDRNAVKIVVHVQEGRAGVIDEIRFVNMTSQEESVALEKLNLKEWSLLTSWATQEGTYRQDMAEHDRLQVLNVLQNFGYADARVTLKVVEIPAKKKIIVEFIADKGPLYSFGELSFDGNQLFSNQEIWDCFYMRPGDPYSPERVRDTVQAIKDLYGSKGRIEAEVQFSTELESNEPVYRLHFKVSEGLEYKVGMVRIFGNQWTQPRIILRECLLIPGSTFDSRRLKATERRLQNIGYFKSVNVYAVKTSSQSGLGEGYRDVYIEVEEDMTASFNLSFGVGTSDGLTGAFEAGERNFYLAGIRDLFSEGVRALRGGGEYIHGKISFGTKQNILGLNWLDPYFHDSLWRVGLDLTRTSGTLQSEDITTVTEGVVARVSYPLSPYVAITGRYRLVREYSTARLPGGLNFEDGSAQAYTQSHPSLEWWKSSPGSRVRWPGASGTVSAFSTSIGFDTTNKPYDPTSGLRSELKGEFAGLGGTTNFVSCAWLNTFYMTIWPIGTVKYRLDFNFMQPLGSNHGLVGIPYNERFFLGGDQSVRGYRPFSLGPWAGPRQPTGGLSSGLASVEWNCRVYNEWRVFAFIDAGSVSDRAWNLPWPWQMSYGAGITVPVFGQAPLTIGYGIPINLQHPGGAQRLFFSMGATF